MDRAADTCADSGVRGCGGGDGSGWAGGTKVGWERDRDGDGVEGRERVEARTYTGMGHVVGGVCARDLGVWIGGVRGGVYPGEG